MAKKNLRYLSQSVLLEESGLPKINIAIILVLFLIVISFIAWSLVMTIEQTITVDGVFVQDASDNLGYSIIAAVTANQLLEIKQNEKAYITVSDIQSISNTQAYIKQIDYEQKQDDTGRVFYQVKIAIVSNQNNIREVVYEGLPANIELVTGNLSLFENILRPISGDMSELFNR